MRSDNAIGFQRMWGSWMDVGAMQEPDTFAIVMVSGALISLNHQIDALLQALKFKDGVAGTFQADVRLFSPLIANVLPEVNRGDLRLDRNLFRVVQLMCKVLEEARESLEDYFLGNIPILHSRTLSRRLQSAGSKARHVISLYHQYCGRKQLCSSSFSPLEGSSNSTSRLNADYGALQKLKEALLKSEISGSDCKPCPKRTLKLVARMRLDNKAIHRMESFRSMEEFDHFCRVGGMEALVQLLNSPSQPVRAQAMVNLENFVTNDQTRMKICNTPGALEQLAAMVSSTDGTVQHEALEVLRRLLRSWPHVDCVRILFPGIVESLLELLDNSSQKVKSNAARVLRELSLDDRTHKKFAATPEAIEKLVRLFRSQSPTLQFCAAATLCNLCLNDSIRTQAINLPSVPSRLLFLLEIYEHWGLPLSGDAQSQCIRSRKNVLTLSPAVAGWWVATLESDLEPLQLIALDTLTKFTDMLIDIAVEEGVLALLVNLLRSPSLVIQEKAAKALWKFSIPQEYELQVARETGAIPRLVELLDSGSFHVRENACKVIESISFNKQSRRRVAEEEGAIEKLSKLLYEDCLGVQANAASALWNLANTNSLNKAEVARMGDTLKRLVDLLDSQSSLVQEKAAGALMNLSYSPNNRKKIFALTPVIPRLVGLLQSRSTLVYQNAAGALYNLSADKENAKTIATTPAAVCSLVKLLGSLSAIVQEYAAGAIANLSSSEETRELCREQGALLMLRELKTSSSTATRTQAKRALDLYHS